jgi:endonuclease III
MAHEHWKNEPDDHDYPAARDYLTLFFDEDKADAIVETLRRAPLVRRKAKDLIRASYHLNEDADIPCKLVDLP